MELAVFGREVEQLLVSRGMELEDLHMHLNTSALRQRMQCTQDTSGLRTDLKEARTSTKVL